MSGPKSNCLSACGHLSVRVNTNSSGAVVGEQGHYPFGESWYIWYMSSSTTKWQFTHSTRCARSGQATYERDAETSLDYAMFRYYHSRIGRFMTPDLLAGSIADPQSLNRYAYVLNNPLNLIDPLGLDDCKISGNTITCDVDEPAEEEVCDNLTFDECMELFRDSLPGGLDDGYEWANQGSSTGGGGPVGPGGSGETAEPRCIPRNKLNAASRAILTALSFWARLSGVTYFAGGSFSRTFARGLGASFTGTYLYAADPQGKQAIVTSLAIQGALGTQAVSGGVEIGSATYQSVQDFAGASTGGSFQVAAPRTIPLAVGGSYTTNSKGVLTSAFIGGGVGGRATGGPMLSATQQATEICQE